MATDWWTSNAPPWSEQMPAGVNPSGGGSTGGYNDDEFRRVVGRAPTPEESQFYAAQPDWQAQLQRNTPQADQQAATNQYGAAAGGGSAGGGGNTDWINQTLQSVQSTDDPGYWAGVIAKDPKAMAGDPSAMAYWQDRIRRGDGSALVTSGQLQRVNDTPGSGGQGASPAELSSYGVPGSPYGSQAYGGNFNTPAVSGGLSTPFTLPTLAELQATPGYQARLDAGLQGRERSAAAQGSILSGGTQKALERYGQDYASNEYSNLFGQQASARGQNQSEYQQNVVQPSMYTQTNQYKQYLDEQNRTLNDYLTNYNINRTGVQDFLTQQNRTADRGLTALSYGRPA